MKSKIEIPTNIQVEMERLQKQAYLDCRSDIESDHPKGVSSLDNSFTELLSVALLGYLQGVCPRCGGRWIIHDCPGNDTGELVAKEE